MTTLALKMTGGEPLPPYSPPLACEDLLLEHRPIRTEKTDGVEEVVVLRVLETDMIALAVSLRVSIEPAKYFSLTVEACLWESGENGVV